MKQPPNQYPQYPQYPQQHKQQPPKKKSPFWLTLIVGFVMVCFYAVRAFWRWYRRQTRPIQIIVAGIIAVVLVIGAISNVMGSGDQSAVVLTPTPTIGHTTILNPPTVNIATDTPTLAPTPTQKPTVKPTPKPQPTQPPVHPTPTQPACQAVNNNPWCYNFSTGNLIYSPPSAFCNYFTCVSTFWTATSGYVAECANGSYTHSDGVRGACSRDGGVLRPLYSH